MSYFFVTIGGALPDNPGLTIRRFDNGSVQIHQSNKYAHRHGKTIYLSKDQFLQLRNTFIEEMN